MENNTKMKKDYEDELLQEEDSINNVLVHLDIYEKIVDFAEKMILKEMDLKINLKLEKETPVKGFADVGLYYGKESHYKELIDKCKKCLGCNRLENPDFIGDYNCKNFVYYDAKKHIERN